MHNLFFELTTVLVLATLLGLAARALKQPTILGYIVAGMVAEPLGLLHFDSIEILDVLAQIGIASLLFLVGMEMRVSDLKDVGKPAVLTGIGQIAFTSIIGYALTRFLGYGSLVALYVSVALTFSSTIIVVKLLSEKHALETLYGRIVIGFLLIQDFVALGFLILLSSLRDSAPTSLAQLPWGDIALAFGKGTLLLIATLAFGKWVMPKLLQRVARSAELVFLIGMAWGMGLSAFAASEMMGLTIEFGAFLAGLAVAGTFERFEISTRIKPVRDFFIVLFFVVLGSRMAIGDLSQVAGPALILSLFVLIGNPLIVLAIMGGLGYRTRVSFLASVTVAQISEFSLIIIALGLRLGHLDDDVVTLVTAVGMFTIAVSSYLIIYAERIHDVIRPALRFFERRSPVAEAAAPSGRKRRNHVVLIGCKRTGRGLLDSMIEAAVPVTVVDINPDVIQSLVEHGVDAIYGDATDPEIRERAGIPDARLVISTMPEFTASLHLVRHLKRTGSPAKTVFTAEHESSAQDLYADGADYVMLPHFTAGALLADALGPNLDMKTLAEMKTQDLRYLADAK